MQEAVKRQPVVQGHAHDARRRKLVERLQVTKLSIGTVGVCTPVDPYQDWPKAGWPFPALVVHRGNDVKVEAVIADNA
jgi:hypothetical protein